MISNPKYGWCNFDLENFHGTPSYLTDVPIDLLNCIIEYIETGCSSCWFDEEGTNFTFVLTPYDVYIISESDSSKLYNFNNIEPNNLIKEIINDIESNMDEWSWFNSFDENEHKSNKILIQSKLDYIKRNIKIGDERVYEKF